MRGLQHKVLAAVDELSFALRVRAPEHEDQMFAFTIERIDRCVCQLFPSFALMTTGFMCLYRQRRIEQQHSLLCPSAQVSAGRNGFA